VYGRYALWRSDIPAWNERRRSKKKKRKMTMMIVNHI
jgi:hypothetical protein